MRHPLLLQRALPRLPTPPVPAPADFETSHLDLAGEPGSSVDPPPDRTPSDTDSAVLPAPAARCPFPQRHTGWPCLIASGLQGGHLMELGYLKMMLVL